MSLSDDVLGKSGVFGFAVEGELVLGFAVRHLVELEPLDRGAQESREELFDVLDVLHLISKRVVDVDSQELPVSLALIDQRQSSEDLHLDDVTTRSHSRANLADVDRVVVAFAPGGLVNMLGPLPRLRQSSIVPDVAFVRENVGNETEFLFLDVLLDRVQGLA